MTILTCGAMRIIDLRKRSATMADDCIGFLDLVWHGAHDGRKGDHIEISTRLPLADHTPSGQFDFYFCSTRCLRAFLNGAVDALEKKIRCAVPTKKLKGN